MKTVRFSQVVERSGQPHVHALWVAPERDPEFVRARKADRVMTVQPRARGKADIGVVGYDPAQPAGQILIFPKSLKPFDGREVVGVKFDLVEQPETQTVNAPQDWKPPARKHGRKSAGGRIRSAEAPPSEELAVDEPPAVEHATRKAPPHASRKKSSSAAESALLRQVHAALKELRAGKAVAAYQRLERAAAEAERR